MTAQCTCACVFRRSIEKGLRRRTSLGSTRNERSRGLNFSTTKGHGAGDLRLTYEQISIVFNRIRYGSSIYRFVPAGGNQWNGHDIRDNGSSVSESGGADTPSKLGRCKAKSVQDRGFRI